ncbi:MAG: PorV/PorQ family protein [Candidatus Marinimicrobia bacterium]|nr:PorV/PorQ family protein [Candidatus Neomarinimicrobiota bacterium]
MKKFSKILAILILGLSFSYGDQGRAGAQFLKIFPGVFGSAMGGASSSLNYSSEVVFWNPAGLNDIRQNSLFVSHADYFAGIRYENIAVTFPLNFGVVSFYGTGLLSGDIRETTVDEPDGTGDYFSANDFAFGVAYGTQLTNKFSVGGGIKMISMAVDKVDALGVAFDAGAKYATGLPGNLTFAFTIKNFGPNISYGGEGLQALTKKNDGEFEEEDVEIEYSSEDFPLPLSFSYAVSVEYPIGEKQKAGLALENWQILDIKEIYRLGITWNYDNLFYLAGGHADLRRLFDPKVSYKTVNGSMKSFTFGGGINLGIIFKKNLWIKYAWEAHEYFDGINRLGLDIAF